MQCPLHVDEYRIWISMWALITVCVTAFWSSTLAWRAALCKSAGSGCFPLSCDEERTPEIYQEWHFQKPHAQDSLLLGLRPQIAVAKLYEAISPALMIVTATSKGMQTGIILEASTPVVPLLKISSCSILSTLKFVCVWVCSLSPLVSIESLTPSLLAKWPGGRSPTAVRRCCSFRRSAMGRKHPCLLPTRLCVNLHAEIGLSWCITPPRRAWVCPWNAQKMCLICVSSSCLCCEAGLSLPYANCPYRIFCC